MIESGMPAGSTRRLVLVQSAQPVKGLPGNLLSGTSLFRNIQHVNCCTDFIQTVNFFTCLRSGIGI